jgi:nucleotide-binding universal stress UspA family protein
MCFDDLIVHVKSGDSAAPLFAVRAAKVLGARLTGLFALRDVGEFKLVADESSPYLKRFIEEEYARAQEAERLFRELASQQGVDCEWQIGEGDAADLLGMAARLQDLIVVAQSDWGHTESAWDVAERMVLTSGKPTVVVPRDSAAATAGNNILVAWNGSREAAQALLAARPFLRRADRVTLLVGQGRETLSTRTKVPKLNVIGYLKRQGIVPAVRPLEDPHADAGEAIIAAATELHADLIVMGAYGRSWLSEWLLGGATRHMLKATPIPVLMAH